VGFFRKRKYYDFYMVELSSYLHDKKVKINILSIDHDDILDGKNIIYFQGETCLKKCEWCEGLLARVISRSPYYHRMYDRVIK
jgi:hypothetical protein